MASIIHIPGANMPAQTTTAARLRRLRRQAKASESVLTLLADLRFGDDPDASWPVEIRSNAEAAHG